MCANAAIANEEIYYYKVTRYKQEKQPEGAVSEELCQSRIHGEGGHEKVVVELTVACIFQRNGQEAKSLDS
ncbi:hypothetical protein DF182_02980 [Chitinophaga flava]|uniref:Uncharacterized protein n=1 Tax=Chitinophaga flava TaxID=2259036 RepID=A0A365Y176_9BACT|nr:hypothetical protein DF182_02980 [Chitinophaga flava]